MSNQGPLTIFFPGRLLSLLSADPSPRRHLQTWGGGNIRNSSHYNAAEFTLKWQRQQKQNITGIINVHFKADCIKMYRCYLINWTLEWNDTSCYFSVKQKGGNWMLEGKKNIKYQTHVILIPNIVFVPTERKLPFSKRPKSIVLK